MSQCQICQREFTVLNKNHIQTHGITVEEYIAQHGPLNPLANKNKKRSSASAVKSKMETAEDMTIYKKRILDRLYSEDVDLVLPDYTKCLMAGDEYILDQIIEDAKKYGWLEVDLETTSLDVITCKIVGVVLTPNTPSYKDNYYIPLYQVFPDTEEKRPGQMDENYVLSKLKPILEGDEVKISYFGSYFDATILEVRGIKSTIDWDALVSMQLLNENLKEYKLKFLVPEFYEYIKEELKLPFDFTVEKYEDIFEKINIRYAPIKTSAMYAAKDGLATRVLREYQMIYIDSTGRLKDVHKMEHQLMPVLVNSRKIGIRPDMKLAKELTTEYRGELDAAIQYFTDIVPLNPNSPKQVGEYLYNELGLPDISGKRNTKADTMDQFLEMFEDDESKEAEDIRMFVENLKVAKGHNKFISTYLEGLDKFINPMTGRIHARFLSWGARTGRFSASDPNLQNLPKRDPKKARARRVYLAEPDHVIIGADFSQIEPRITAHISGDPTLIRAFNEDRDLYSEMATQLFHKPYEECIKGSVYRQKTKTLWLAMTYSMTPKGLSLRLKVSKKEAESIMNNFFDTFYMIRDSINDYIRFCSKNGYVETLLGRKRRLPDIWSDEWWIRESVKRKVFNSVIQGTAADALKMAMINLYYDNRFQKNHGIIYMNIHDELVISSPPGDIAIENSYIIEENMVRVREQLGITSIPFQVELDIYTDGRWSSDNKVSLDKIKSGKVNPKEIKWLVA